MLDTTPTTSQQVRLLMAAAVLGGRLKRLQDDLAQMQKKGQRDQLLFFVLGVVVSIPIGIAINIVF